jgi:hypothetical protein
LQQTPSAQKLELQAVAPLQASPSEPMGLPLPVPPELVPALFVAVTVTVYVTPLTSPVMSHVVVGAEVVQVCVVWPVAVAVAV